MRVANATQFPTGYRFPSHFSMLVVGSTGVGKTTFVYNLIKYNIIDKPKMIKYFYPISNKGNPESVKLSIIV